MGLGSYRHGRFELTISFLFTPTDAVRARWKNAFEHASAMLFEATHGQMRFGSIVFAEEGLANREADALILPTPGAVTAFQLGFRAPGFPMVLRSPADEYPAYIVHEFGHYAFDLGEEYITRPTQDGRSPPLCNPEPDGMAKRACFMAYVKGYTRRLEFDDSGAVKNVDRSQEKVTQFCDPHNHQAHNDQHDRHGESCWQTIVRRYPDLVMPTGLSATPSVRAPDPPSFVARGASQQLVFVVDKSPDTEPYSTFRAVRGAFRFLQQGLKPKQVDLLLIVNGDYKSKFQGRWKAIWDHPGPSPGIVASLELALELGTARDHEVTPACSVLLVSDGRGPLDGLDELIERLVDARVRVCCVGAGHHADHSVLRRVAWITGGSYERTTDDPDVLNVQRDVQEALSLAAVELVEDYGLVSLRRYGAKHQPSVIESRQRGDSGRGAHISAHIEKGSEHALFVLMSAAHHGLSLDVEHDSGASVDLKRDTSASYELLSIDNPPPGSWTLTVQVRDSLWRPWHREVGFTLAVFSRNPQIQTGLRDTKPAHAVGDDVDVMAIAYHSEPEPEGVGPPRGPVSVRAVSTEGSPKWGLEPMLNHGPDTGERARADMTYSGTFRFSETGSYEVLVEFVDRLYANSTGYMRTERTQIQVDE